MLNRAKIRRAAEAAPLTLDTAIKHHVLDHLHRCANRKGVRHQHTYRQQFDCTVFGLGIRPSRLLQLLEDVAAAPKSERANLLRSELWAMHNNSERSERQKINARKKTGKA